MSTARYQSIKDVFQRVIAHPREERASLLERCCGSDAELRREVESLLAHADDPAVDLEALAADLGTLIGRGERGTQEAPLPERLGRYRILGLLGEGGMGVVYLAEQDSPRRTVALKVVRAWAGSGSAARRFEQETQMLGRLQHPGIGQIFEAGTAPCDGAPRPYFAMEYVAGLPLVDHAEAQRLATHHRIELMIKVCDAVEHAHRQGIVHRDLKPSNILVTEEGNPKVLDFGVARSTDADLAVTTMQTNVGALIGTLAYMSPEQMAGDGRRLDHRSDVYSLGVVLYELLAGRLPHDLRERTIPEAARLVQEVDPPTIGTINRIFRGDIETIVGKALEKEPARRYAKASTLAADLRRWLDHEPIRARPPSAMYQLRKFARRHTTLLGAAVAVFAALVVGMIGTSFGMLEARQQRDDAIEARNEADNAQGHAEREAQRAGMVTDYLIDVLGLADPDLSRDPDMTMPMMLDRASSEVGDVFRGHPHVEARVRTVIGHAYAAIGDPEMARPHLLRALELVEADSESTVYDRYRILRPLALVHFDAGDRIWQVRMLEVERLARTIIERDHPELGQVLRAIALPMPRRPERVPEQIAAVRRHASRLDPAAETWLTVAESLLLNAIFLGYNGHYEAASAYLRESLAMSGRVLPDTHSRLARAQGLLVEFAIADGRFAEAERLAHDALEQLHDALPSDHWYVALTRGRLGAALVGQARYGEAEALLREAHPIVARTRGPSHPYTVRLAARLVDLSEGLGLAEQAERDRRILAAALVGSLSHSTWDLARPAFGDDLEGLRAALDQLDAAVRALGDVGAAFDEVLVALAGALAGDDPRAALIADQLTVLGEYHANHGGSLETAAPLFHEATRLGRAEPRRPKNKLARTVWWTAYHAERAGAYEAGETAAREAVALYAAAHGADDWTAHNARSVLGGCLVGQGRMEEAEPLILESYEGLLESMGAANPNTRVAWRRVIDLYESSGRSHLAIEAQRRRLEEMLAGRGGPREIARAAWILARRRGLDPEVYREALAASERAVDLAPTDPEALNALGTSLYRTGRLRRAVETLRRADALRPRAVPHDWAVLAAALHRLGDRPGAAAAMATLEEAVREWGEDARIDALVAEAGALPRVRMPGDGLSDEDR